MGLAPATHNKTTRNGEVLFQIGKHSEVDVHRLIGGKCPACVVVPLPPSLHLAADVHPGIRAGE